MSTPKFKVGDVVRVLKRDFVKNEKGYTDGMLKYEGGIYYVIDVGVRGNWYSLDSTNGYSWEEEWLELVGEKQTMPDLKQMEQHLKNIEEEAAKLREMIEKEKNKKWEPKGGDWFVDIEGDVREGFSDAASSNFGAEFETEAAANKASIAYRQYHRLYKLAEELNEGWEPDWSNRYYGKWFICYSISDERWIIEYTLNYKQPTTVYFKSKEAVTKALEIFKAGELHG